MTQVTAAGPSPIAICRLMLGWSQDDLASRAGVRRETVSRIERGASPSLRTARAVATVLGVDADLLFPVNDEERARQHALATTSPNAGGRYVDQG